MSTEFTITVTQDDDGTYEATLYDEAGLEIYAYDWSAAEATRKAVTRYYNATG